MPTLANDLVQFLMHLFGDAQATRDFLEDPERVLADHGLGHVSPADVDAAMPVVLDYAPISVNASLDRDDHTGSNVAGSGHPGWSGPVAAAGSGSDGGAGGPGGFAGFGGAHDQDHTYAVQQLHQVVNHYSYTAGASIVDDRHALTDQSVSQNIWADGDVEQWFDNAAVVAPGDQSAAAGDAADPGGSHSVTDTYNTDLALDVDDALNDDSGTWDSPDHSVMAEADLVEADNPVDEDYSTGNPVPVADSFNQEDSFQDDPGTGVLADNALAADSHFEFNDDASSHTDAGADSHPAIDDSAVDDSTAL
ncbi:MAG: hypothetical protein HOQ06_05375 [Pseudarthrobacter sp.]|nr:hypothetical protein [Pseudarthrobacter sp.]